MKVTSCYSIIGFDDINTGLKIFRDFLGCKVVHHPEIPENEYYVVEDASGNRTDLVSGPYMKTGFQARRINVDNIEEAVALFEQNGAKLIRGIFDYPNCKMAIMNDDSDTSSLVIYEHKKH